MAVLKIRDGSTWVEVGGPAANSFETINCPSGTDPVADSATDTLNLTTPNAHLNITGNSATDTVDFAIVTGTSGAVLVLANTANTWSANQLLSGTTELQLGISSNRIFASSNDIVIDAVGAVDIKIGGVSQFRIDVLTILGAVDSDLMMVNPGATLTAQFKGIDELTTAGVAHTVDYLMFWDASDGIHKKAFVKEFFKRAILKDTSGTWGSAGEVLISTSTSVVDWTTLSTTNLSDGSNIILADGTVGLSAAWDAGAFEVRALTFQSDVATGVSPPFVVASTDKVINLAADTLDGLHVGTSGSALGALNVANTWSADQLFSGGSESQYRASGQRVYSSGPSTLDIDAAAVLNFRIGGLQVVALASSVVLSNVPLSAPRFTSTVADGTQPYACTSETENTHFNSNFLQGHTATGLLIEDGVDDTPTTLAVSTDPVMALVLSTTTGVASVFYEAHGYLVGAANNEAEWTIAVEDPDGVVLKTIIVKQDATGTGDTFRIPFYIQGYDTGPNTGATGYHLDVDEVSGSASLEVLQTKLTKVAS